MRKLKNAEVCNPRLSMISSQTLAIVTALYFMEDIQMNHELHGRWHSFLLRKLPSRPLELVPEGILDLKMTHAETGDVEAGSNHGADTGTPSPPPPSPVTGKAVPANGGYNITLQETLAGGGRLYQGSLIGRTSGQLILGGTRTLTSSFLLADAATSTGKKAKRKAKDDKEARQLADGQEEGIWVATKP